MYLQGMTFAIGALYRLCGDEYSSVSFWATSALAGSKQLGQIPSNSAVRLLRIERRDLVEVFYEGKIGWIFISAFDLEEVPVDAYKTGKLYKIPGFGKPWIQLFRTGTSKQVLLACALDNYFPNWIQAESLVMFLGMSDAGYPKIMYQDMIGWIDWTLIGPAEEENCE